MRTQPTSKSDRLTAWTVVILTTVLLGGVSGCRLCCDGEDIAYPAYGGVWERTERNSGRVGSLYDPAGARAASLADRNAPADNDEARSNIIPPGRLDEELLNEPPVEPVPEDMPQPRSEEESDEEFQERLKEFQKRKKQEDDAMLNTMIIPGTPLPPRFP